MLNKGAKSDIRTWLSFLDHFNGAALIITSQWNDANTRILVSDSSKLGFGIFFQNHWVNARWDEVGVATSNSMAYLELYPIVLGLLVGADQLGNSKVRFDCDNLAVVNIMNKQSSKCPKIMKLVRKLVLVCLQKNIIFRSFYIRSASNVTGDSLSRFQIHRFFQAQPAADRAPTQYKQFLPLG